MATRVHVERPDPANPDIYQVDTTCPVVDEHLDVRVTTVVVTGQTTVRRECDHCGTFISEASFAEARDDLVEEGIDVKEWQRRYGVATDQFKARHQMGPQT